MKKAFIIFAWISILGSIGDFLIALYGVYLSFTDASVEPSITVDQLIKNYIRFLYWVKQVAYDVLPSDFVGWLFNLPALLYFPIRIVVSILIGWFALRLADTME